MHADLVDGSKFSEVVHFRENKRILEIVDRVASSRGTDRSAIYRESVRFWLTANKHLTDHETG